MKGQEATKMVLPKLGESRKWKVKKDNLTKIEKNSNVSSFDKHLIQEGIKQLLFAQGTECVRYHKKDEIGHILYEEMVVPKEMIEFLKDHDLIEEFKY